jgi:hypothetical protein
MATPPGEQLSLALGFTVVERVVVTLAGVDVPFTRMTRDISAGETFVQRTFVPRMS